MKHLTLFVSLLLLSTYMHAQLQFVKQFAGSNDNAFYDMTFDKNGNIYTAGRFSGTTDFDPHPTNTYTLSSAGSAYDVFITKLDPLGNFLWTKSMGDQYYDEAQAIAVDTSGNVYVTGNFRGTVDFDPGVATYTLTAASSMYDQFILKLNPAGNFVWVKQIGGGTTSSAVQPYDIAVDLNHKVYTTGVFYYSVDFEPGAGTVTMTPTPPGSGDAFVSVLDSAGNYVMAKQMGGTNINSDQGEGIKVDLLGNIYVAGRYNGTADFDPSAGTYTMTSNGNHENFICKLSPAGALKWAKSFGGIANDFLYSLHMDLDANIYTCGSFLFNVDFDPGAATYTINAGNTNYDAFVSKLDSAGNFKWARSFNGSTATVEAHDITTDLFGNVLSTGRFTGTVDFDPGAGIVNLASGSQKEFISILDTGGMHICAMQMESAGGGVGSAILGDPAGTGYVYTSGSFYGTTDFDPGASSYTIASTSTISDGFIKKVSCNNLTETQELTQQNDHALVFPNPSNGIFSVNTHGTEINSLKVMDVSGRCILSQNVSSDTIRLDLRTFSGGMYFLHLIDDTGYTVNKIVLTE